MGSRGALGVWEGFGIQKGERDLEGSWGSGKGLWVGEEGSGRRSKKNPQHVCNNPKYSFFLHIRNTVVFLTNHQGALNSFPLCSMSHTVTPKGCG